MLRKGPQLLSSSCPRGAHSHMENHDMIGSHRAKDHLAGPPHCEEIGKGLVTCSMSPSKSVQCRS